MNNSTLSIQKKVTAMLVALMLTSSMYAAVFTAVASGNYNSTATWSGGVAPPAFVLLDQIFIPAGITVNLNNDITLNGALASLDVAGTLSTTNSSSIAMTLGKLSGAGTLTVNALTVSLSPAFSFAGTLNVTTLNSAAGFQSSADILVGQSLNLTAGTLSLVSGGSLAVGTGGTIFVSGGSLTAGIGGTVTLSNNYNVSYSGVSSLAGVELSGIGLRNVTVNVAAGNSVTLASSLTVVGTLTLTNGTLVLAGNDLTINGPVAVAGSGTISSTAVSSISVNTTSGIAGTLTFSGLTPAVKDFTINIGAGNTATIGGNLTVNGTLQLNSGTLNFNDASLSIGGNISGTGSLSSNSSSNLTISTLTGLTTALKFATGGQTLNDLSLSVGAGNSASLVSNLNVNGMLTILAGSSFNLNGNTLILGSASSMVGTGMIAATPTSNIIINSTVGISSLMVSGTIGSFTVNSGGSANVTLGNDLTVDGTLTLQSGSLILNGNDLNITGTIAAAGSGTISSSDMSNISVATATAPMGALRFNASADTVGNLEVNIGNSGSLAIATDLNVTDTLRFMAGKLNMASNQLTIGTMGAIKGASSSAYVITTAGGSLEQNVLAGGSTSVAFPIGTSTNYAPANIHLNTGSASGKVQVGVVNDVKAQGTTGVDFSASRSVVDATWNVSSSIVGAFNLDLKVMWSAAMEVNGFNRNAAYLSHYISGGWDMSATSAATAEAGGMYSIQKTALTTLSPFAVFDQNTTTAIGEINNDIQFQVYPNPTADNINIQNTSASTESVNMDIYNSKGELMGNFKLTNVTSTISIDGLANGSYFIKFYNSGMNSTKRFIKM